DAHEVRSVFLRAIAGTGAGIPGTGLKIRVSPHLPELLIEPGDGTEAVELPANWLTFVRIIDFIRKNGAIVCFGKNVRADCGAMDPENFQEVEAGWRRVR